MLNSKQQKIGNIFLKDFFFGPGEKTTDCNITKSKFYKDKLAYLRLGP